MYMNHDLVTRARVAARRFNRNRSGARWVIVLLALLMMAETAWLFRWEIIPSGSQSIAHQLDRWTGDVWILAGGKRLSVDDAK